MFTNLSRLPFLFETIYVYHGMRWSMLGGMSVLLSCPMSYPTASQTHYIDLVRLATFVSTTSNNKRKQWSTTTTIDSSHHPSNMVRTSGERQVSKHVEIATIMETIRVGTFLLRWCFCGGVFRGIFPSARIGYVYHYYYYFVLVYCISFFVSGTPLLCAHLKTFQIIFRGLPRHSTGRIQSGSVSLLCLID